MKFTYYQRVAVYAFIENSKGETLLIQRAMHDSFPGQWELPGGGLEFGEVAHDAVKREVKEEAGIDVTVLHPIFVHSSTNPHNGIDRQLVSIIFYCKPEDETQLVKIGTDHMAFKWISIEHYKEQDRPKFFEKMLKIKEEIYAKQGDEMI